MNIIREIGIYQKHGEDHIDSVNINAIPEHRLIEIFGIDVEDDPTVLKVYNINLNQYLELSKLVPELQKFDYNEVDMYCESFY